MTIRSFEKKQKTNDSSGSYETSKLCIDITTVSFGIWDITLRRVEMHLHVTDSTAFYGQFNGDYAYDCEHEIHELLLQCLWYRIIGGID